MCWRVSCFTTDNSSLWYIVDYRIVLDIPTTLHYSLSQYCYITVYGLNTLRTKLTKNLKNLEIWILEISISIKYKMYSYMYIVTLCVCLLQICQLTCVPAEEARRVLQAYTAIKLII